MLTNRHLVLLCRLAERPDLAWEEPALFDELVRAGHADRSLETPRGRQLGQPTAAGTEVMAAWLGRPAVMPVGKGLTRQMRQALDVIGASERERGIAPTREELKTRLGLSSKSGAQRLIRSLVERGHLIHVPHRARALTIVSEAAD
jgi:hypothetical protein